MISMDDRIRKAFLLNNFVPTNCFATFANNFILLGDLILFPVVHTFKPLEKALISGIKPV